MNLPGDFLLLGVSFQDAGSLKRGETGQEQSHRKKFILDAEKVNGP